MAFVKLLRPHQYIKNLLVFFPLFFALKINNIALLKQSMIAFAAFCFAASTIYIINDIRDIEKDRAHPEKKSRPLASGKVSIKSAVILSVILFLAAVAVSYFGGMNLFFIIGFYILMNIGYSFGLKNVSLIDIFIVSSGFLMRLLAGTHFGGIEGINPSHWIIIMTFLMSLFLAFAKRRDRSEERRVGKECRTAWSPYP